MITRIVKLTFRSEACEPFLETFKTVEDKIRATEGCEHLELKRQVDNSQVFFTISFWQSEEHLEKYRHSDLFRTTWAKTKTLFADKPQAWSLVAP